jgi:hypothetical protein
MLEFHKSDLAETIAWVVGILAFLWKIGTLYKSKKKEYEKCF